MGEVLIRQESGGWRLFHHADASAAGTGSLAGISTPADAREIARHDGWELSLTSPTLLLEALDYLYPAAVANWMRYLDGQIPPHTLKEMLGRQTGMYRITRLLREDEAQSLVAATCHDGNCRRKIHWTWDEQTAWTSLPAGKISCPRHEDTAVPALPLLCTDACPLLIAAARPVVKDRQKAEAATVPATTLPT